MPIWLIVRLKLMTIKRKDLDFCFPFAFVRFFLVLTVAYFGFFHSNNSVSKENHEKPVSLGHSLCGISWLHCRSRRGVTSLQLWKRIRRSVFPCCWNDSDVRCFHRESLAATSRLTGLVDGMAAVCWRLKAFLHERYQSSGIRKIRSGTNNSQQACQRR